MFKFLDKPPSGTTFEAFKKRLDWVKKKSGITIDPEEKKWGSEVKGVIENPIGFVKIPLGIAGPIQIDGSYAKGEYIIPLATVEGTLSMSLNRGAFFTKMAGGIKTKHLRQSLSRSPVFFAESMDEATRLDQFVKDRFIEIKKVAESTTSHGKLLSIDPYYIGSRLILDFSYFTGDAAGQNMTTFATWEACQWIQKQFNSKKPIEFFIESNFNGDKNISFRSTFKGRGHAVTAECIFPRKLIDRILGSKGLSQVLKGANIGTTASQMSGIPTYNLHTVNALTAIYLACGQDAACVVENALNIFSVDETENGDLRTNLYIPSLTVGTVGGGTYLEDQQKNLKILDCVGEGSAKKFAEIICASALAIEISLGIAITNQEFVQSHLKYSRGK